MKLDDVKKLHQKKYRSQFGYYLIEGEHLILELLKALNKNEDKRQQGLLSLGFEDGDVTIYVTPHYEDWCQALKANFIYVSVNEKQMAQLSNTKTPQGIIARVPLLARHNRSVNIQPAQGENSSLIVPSKNTSYSLASRERYVYLHEVQDPGNLGTIIRSLAWFGQFRLLLSANSVDPYNPKVVRASMGAIFHVPIELDVQMSELATRFERFAYLDMQGNSINSHTFSQYDCYLFGNEARGVPVDMLASFNADAFTIAGAGCIDSLNLATAVNICIYELSR